MQHLRSSTDVILTALLTTTTAPTQVVAVDVDRAIAELAVPARQWEASLALLRAGDVAVPQVQAVLRAHQERTATMVEMALLVAGRRGRDAVTLLPDLEAIADWSAAAVEAVVRNFAERTNVKLGAVAQPLRAALTGKTTSPPIFDVLAVLGRDDSLDRLRDQAAT